MRHTVPSALALALASFGLLGCQDAPTNSGAVAMDRFASSGWSAPENLGVPVNSTGSDQNATLSKDGLSLFLSSDRVGTRGGLDIWVAQRPTTESPWGPPQNLAAINTTAAELAPNLSVDGHWLFFTSNRTGSAGIDIWMSRRTHTDDDFSWEPPVRLGPGVNTPDVDQAPMYLQNAEDGPVNLYFNRGVLQAGQGDIYAAAITREGETLGDAVAVHELNSSANDAAVSIRRDGREIFFWSNRAGTQDLWTSTRQSVHHPWTAPTRLEAPLSSASNDLTPSLSWDGRTLIFSTNRQPSAGGNDLWITTRSPSAN